ncbi:ribbon-helix-helix protein, CopG family [Tritonibacter mobilis]|uniref:ribbon-helix-helix protein, CopG family n=1 Tax=Tritonibacter mobilis TaxID=379347 RepID=UPI003A5BCBB9
MAAAQKNSRVSVSFTERDHTLLTQIAEDRDTSLAWVIRQAVSEYLERNPPEEPSLPLPRPDQGHR